MGAVTCLRGDKDSYRTAVGLHSNTPQGITSARWFATTDWIRFLESRFKDCLRLSLSTEPSSAAVTIHPNPPLAGVIPRPNPISCSLNLFIEQLSTNLSNRSIILRIVCRRFLYFKVWPPSVLESRPIDGRDEDQRPSAPTKLPRVFDEDCCAFEETASYTSSADGVQSSVIPEVLPTKKCECVWRDFCHLHIPADASRSSERPSKKLPVASENMQF